MTTSELVQEYAGTVYDFYGTYLDAVVACKHRVFDMQEQQRHSMKEFNLTQEEIDNRLFGYADSPPGPNTQMDYSTTQGDFKKQNSQGGRNLKLLAQMFVTQVYSYWEDHYRGLIAESLHINKSELLSNIFGDLRHFRHSIIHHRGYLLEDINKFSDLRLFEKGEEIDLTEDQIKYIYYSVMEQLENIINK